MIRIHDGAYIIYVYFKFNVVRTRKIYSVRLCSVILDTKRETIDHPLFTG